MVYPEVIQNLDQYRPNSMNYTSHENKTFYKNTRKFTKETHQNRLQMPPR